MIRICENPCALRKSALQTGGCPACCPARGRLPVHSESLTQAPGDRCDHAIERCDHAIVATWSPPNH